MKPIRRTAVVLLALAALLLSASAAHADHLATVKVIDAELLKAWLDQGRKMVLIDSRVGPEYREAHIPTATSIPAPLMHQYREKLPKNLDYPLVFYCNGWPECKKSHEACGKAVEWGYRQVYWFRDGIPAWQAKGYPTE